LIGSLENAVIETYKKKKMNSSNSRDLISGLLILINLTIFVAS